MRPDRESTGESYRPTATDGLRIRPARWAGAAAARSTVRSLQRMRGVGALVRERLSRAVVSGSGGLTALSFVTGAGAGFGAVAFRYMILGFTELFSGHRDYSAVGDADNPLVPGLGSGSWCWRR